MTHWIGTSGFQYPEWKGKFYPDDLSAAKMLPYYAERFSTTEINYSFRRMPSVSTLEKWAGATPKRFVFSLKAPQKITHFAKLRDCAETANFFLKTVRELEGKLGCVLFQLPPTFVKDAMVLREFLGGLEKPPRLAFEFRHESWFADEVYGILREAGAALCVAESEERRTPMEATAAFGYLRLRREDYKKADLVRWAEEIRKKQGWAETFIYFKHEEAGVGPKFAATMMKLLAEEAEP